MSVTPRGLEARAARLRTCWLLVKPRLLTKLEPHDPKVLPGGRVSVTVFLVCQ